MLLWPEHCYFKINQTYYHFPVISRWVDTDPVTNLINILWLWDPSSGTLNLTTIFISSHPLPPANAVDIPSSAVSPRSYSTIWGVCCHFSATLTNDTDVISAILAVPWSLPETQSYRCQYWRECKWPSALAYTMYLLFHNRERVPNYDELKREAQIELGGWWTSVFETLHASLPLAFPM